MRCEAKSKRSGVQCKARAVTGKTKCRMHGGKTPSGYGLPQTTHGRYSKVLPVRLASRYEEALTNKDLLSLRDDLAACESRLSDLFQRVDSGESGQRWRELRAVMEAFRAALVARDMPAVQAQLAIMRDLIRQGSDDYAAWREILAVWETRCKLTVTEQKTLVAMQQMVSTQQLMVMIGTITDAIQRAVSTHAAPAVARRILGDLSEEFTRIGLRAGGAEA